MCSECTSQTGCEADTPDRCLSVGDTTKLTCTTASAGYYLDSAVAVECSSVSNAAAGATYTCTSASDSDVSACAAGFFEDASGSASVCSECTSQTGCDEAVSFEDACIGVACIAVVCKESTCDPFTGTCGYVAVRDGTSCEDGDIHGTKGDVCQSGLCLGYSVMQVTLDADIDRLLADVQAMDDFKWAFSKSVAATIGVSADRVHITNIVPGSIIVSFFVAPGSGGNAISSAAAVRHIQNATAGNVLRDMLLTEGISCTEPCSVSLLSNATRLEPSKSEPVSGTSKPTGLGDVAVYGAALVTLAVLALALCVWFAYKWLGRTKETTTTRETEYTDNPVHELAQNRSTQQQLPLNWVERFDPETQRAYFVNISTKERTWTRPASGAHVPGNAQALQATSKSWVQRTDMTSGRIYYVNLSTGQSSWNLPTGGQVSRHVQRKRASHSVNTDPVLDEMEV